VQYCAECGSADLSTPAPPPSILHLVSGFALYLVAGLSVALLALSLALALLRLADWLDVMPRLVALLLMLGFLYWTTTLLPGPVRHMGKAAGRMVFRSRRSKH
jgi:hypothetical protein